jgi:uncharacterized membrane protein YhdT
MKPTLFRFIRFFRTQQARHPAPWAAVITLLYLAAVLAVVELATR